MNSFIKRLFLLGISLWAITAQAQWLSSSNLPIVIITTDLIPGTNEHYSIPDEPKVPATMKILYVNDTTRNYLSNQNDTTFLNYCGRIGIELRGSTSQGHNKKPYGFETRMDDDVTNRNVSLLGMPAENDWILNPMNDEPSFLRDCLSYNLYSALGHYAPRTHYCEVIVNGDYRGLYFLTEKIKIDKNRVNIVSLDSADISFPDISGGYIMKADKLTGGDVPAWTTPAYDYWEDVNYIYHYPKPEEITAEQGAYIHQYFDSVALAIANQNEDVNTGFPALIDIASFIDYMIIGEFASNVDIYQKSTFFHKDRCGKLRAGPVWDFNLAYGYDFGPVGRSGYDVLQFDNGDNTGSEFWHQLYENDTYRCHLSARWNKLKGEGCALSLNRVNGIIDSLASIIQEAMPRERARWNRNYNYTNHINTMKRWIDDRFHWLDNTFNQTQNCLDMNKPPLVISAINYHPPAMQGHASDELEFIGITNNSYDTLDVSGVYFKELGVTYTFPAGSIIYPQQEIFLASNQEAFLQCFHTNAYGQFSRNLSNKSESLILATAWGTV
ncbi:MAG: CotH kinase family protein, partial [Bacteroidales bacterium]|nr:CotH kinase family protein [Bacteroidales bacterium]